LQSERILVCNSAGEKSFLKIWRIGDGMLSAVARTPFGTANKACPAFCMSINKYIIKVSNTEKSFHPTPPITHIFYVLLKYNMELSISNFITSKIDILKYTYQRTQHEYFHSNHFII
jgi:hypothetical protein